MLDQRLVGKRLDIRIKGTVKALYHNGKWEDQCGYLVLQKTPVNEKDMILVKMGYSESQIRFTRCYLFPQMTTERPGFVDAKAARPVISSIGQRVVIIGPDAYGNSDRVGEYACIVHCPYNIPSHQALVMISFGQFFGEYRYYNESCLCRSHMEADI